MMEKEQRGCDVKVFRAGLPSLSAEKPMMSCATYLRT
jgi:hypothetical protein